MERRPAVVAFVGWTLLVWGTRVRNVLVDPDLDGIGRAVALGRAALFVVLAAAVAVALVRRARWGRPVTAALAALTVVVWALAMADISLDPDHSAGFKLVHAALAAVSVASAVLAGRAVTGRGPRRDLRSRRGASAAPPAGAGTGPRR